MTDAPFIPPIKQSYTRAVMRLLGLILLALICFLPVVFIWLLRLDTLRGRIVCWYYDMMRRICGIQVTVEGTPSNLRPLMLVANHSSYLDIFVLGSLMPMSFTPKSEIRSWPVIGFFCVLADCVFIERKAAAMEQAQGEIEAKLRAGKVITLFPEGTTGDGFTVKHFKSGFMRLAETHQLPLQPLSIAYTHIGQTPLSAANREMIAWIGEATLVGHLMRLLSFPYVQVTARFYGVEQISAYEDRKALAKACEVIITDGLHQTLTVNGVAG